MSVLLFKLFNVPEDEADDVRQLLAEHNVHTYETQAGFFGLGVAAIWLEDRTQLTHARALIDEYQNQRCRDQRALYAQQKARGEVPTLGQKMAEQPLRTAATILAIAVVIIVSLLPIWMLVGR